MSQYLRPQRTFKIESTKAPKTEQQLDEIVQGTIEGQLAEFIQQDNTLNYAFQNQDIEAAKQEAEAIIKSEARRFLKSAHENNPAEIADFSANHQLVEEIAANALEMVGNYLEAENNHNFPHLESDNTIATPV